METTDHTPAADTATLEQLNAIRRSHAQRMLDMAEALLQSFEAVELPKDAAGVERACKALLTLGKVMDFVHTNARTLAQQALAEKDRDELMGRPPRDPAETAKGVDLYRMAQNLRLEALALNRSAKTATPAPTRR